MSKIAKKNLTFFSKNCHFFQQNCHWQKMTIFVKFFEKNVKFLAIFWSWTIWEKYSPLEVLTKCVTVSTSPQVGFWPTRSRCSRTCFTWLVTSSVSSSVYWRYTWPTNLPPGACLLATTEQVSRTWFKFGSCHRFRLLCFKFWLLILSISKCEIFMWELCRKYSTLFTYYNKQLNLK